VSITRRHRRRIAIAVWSCASLALAGALVWAAVAPDGAPWSMCTIPPARYGPQVPQAVAVVVCVLAFLVGHVSCDLDPAPPRRVALAELAARLRRRRIGPQAIVVGLLMLASVGLLVYETVALQYPHSLVAITYYVRCANVIQNYRTVALAGALCFLAGRWFRYPWWSA